MARRQLGHHPAMRRPGDAVPRWQHGSHRSRVCRPAMRLNQPLPLPSMETRPRPRRARPHIDHLTARSISRRQRVAWCRLRFQHGRFGAVPDNTLPYSDPGGLQRSGGRRVFGHGQRQDARCRRFCVHGGCGRQHSLHAGGGSNPGLRFAGASSPLGMAERSHPTWARARRLRARTHAPPDLRPPRAVRTTTLASATRKRARPSATTVSRPWCAAHAHRSRHRSRYYM